MELDDEDVVEALARVVRLALVEADAPLVVPDHHHVARRVDRHAVRDLLRVVAEALEPDRGAEHRIHLGDEDVVVTALVADAQLAPEAGRARERPRESDALILAGGDPAD